MEQIAELRSTPPRQKLLEIFNYLRKMFNGPTGEESASRGEGAGNNSEKLKNEIRQILYFLYRFYKNCL